MAKGRKTSRTKRLKLLTLYAATGNTKLAAEKVGIPVSTAFHLVSAAIRGDDEEGHVLLGKVGADLCDDLIDMAQRMGAEVLAEAHKRALDPEWISRNSLQNDPGPQYAKVVSDGIQKLGQLRRILGELKGEVAPSGATIILTPPESFNPDDPLATGEGESS